MVHDKIICVDSLKTSLWKDENAGFLDRKMAAFSFLPLEVKAWMGNRLAGVAVGDTALGYIAVFPRLNLCFLKEDTAYLESSGPV